MLSQGIYPRSLNYSLSDSSGNYGNKNMSTYTTVTNLSTTIDVTGDAPVMLMLINDGSGTDSEIVGSRPSTYAVTWYWQYLRGSTSLGTNEMAINVGSGTNACNVNYPHGGFSHVDFPPVGQHTYYFQVIFDYNNTFDGMLVRRVKLLVYEMYS